MKYRIILAVVALVVLTACTKEEKDSVNSNVIAKASMECTLMVATEALNSFDFFVKYYDADGKEKSEQLVDWKDSKEKLTLFDISQPAKEWTKTVTVSEFPATLGLFFEAKPKDGIDTNAAYEWLWGYRRVFNTTKATGGVLYSDPDLGSESRFAVQEGKLEEALNAGRGRLLNFIYTVQSGGTITTGKWQ